MTSASWLALAEYSNKYQVSISTLRRRIRSGRAEVKFLDGKYYLKDSPLIDHQIDEIMNLNTDGQVPPQQTNSHNSQNSGMEDFSSSNSERLVFQQETPFISTANNLLNEIKKAYMLVLQEKEEQILILKEEISNLNMLVKVLEGENERLKTRRPSSSDATWNI